MGSPARATLDELLATGKVVRSRLLQPETELPCWEFGRLSGRVVEVIGHGGAARLTVAVRLVHAAQGKKEPVAWIGGKEQSFYPPDVAEEGVDLNALAVLRLDGPDAMLRAADQLLRSGAFGLVVLDFPQAVELPHAAQVRLLNLTKAHHSVLLILLSDARSSLASLRARSERQRTRRGEGRFACRLRVIKDKRVGREWEHKEVFRGPLGLR